MWPNCEEKKSLNHLLYVILTRLSHDRPFSGHHHYKQQGLQDAERGATITVWRRTFSLKYTCLKKYHVKNFKYTVLFFILVTSYDFCYDLMFYYLATPSHLTK